MLEVTETIDNAIRSGAKSLQINVWIEGQILFQILPSRFLTEHGYDATLGSYSEVHFFNKNKTKTPNVENQLINDFFFWEQPKNYSNYAKEVSNNPVLINDLINNRINNLYKLENTKIRVEVVDY